MFSWRLNGNYNSEYTPYRSAIYIYPSVYYYILYYYTTISLSIILDSHLYTWIPSIVYVNIYLPSSLNVN